MLLNFLHGPEIELLHFIVVGFGDDVGGECKVVDVLALRLDLEAISDGRGDVARDIRVAEQYTPYRALRQPLVPECMYK